MSQIYNLPAKIHELLPQVKDKYDLKFEVEFNELYLVSLNYEGVKFFPNLKQKLFGVELPAIQHLQIRQILVGLSRVLGENKESVKKLKQIYSTKYNHKSIEFFEIIQEAKSINSLVDTLEDFNYHEERKLIDELLPKSQAEALDDKWLRPIKKDGKYTGQSLFDREPLFVLHELCEILENLLK